MSRELLEDCSNATVELKGSASLASRFGRFERGKPRNIQDRAAIAFCLSKPTFRVAQFDDSGEKLADTDDQKSVDKPKPASYKRKVSSDEFEPIELQDERREQAAAEAAKRQAKLEQEWLDEEKVAKERKAEAEGVEAQSFPAWSPGMSRAQLASLLSEVTGEPDGGLTKAKIIEALEALGD